jgi:hypothetical protein
MRATISPYLTKFIDMPICGLMTESYPLSLSIGIYLKVSQDKLLCIHYPERKLMLVDVSITAQFREVKP